MPALLSSVKMNPSLRVSALLVASILSSTQAFQVSKHGTNSYAASSSPTQLFSTTLSLERTAQREIDEFQGWAGSCGVQPENGFCLEGDLVDENEDYYAATSTGAAQGSRLLYVPGEMILSSSRIAEEYNGYIDGSLEILSQTGVQHLQEQFYLFVKVLLEYEQGEESPYFPWFQAMPRKWNTAVSMDDFCLSCLPPFIKSLCQTERDQLGKFKSALTNFEYVSPESKSNNELLEFAYNVVFTRSWRSDEGDYRIVPVADMMNHGYPDNVEIRYDEDSGCELYAKEDVQPGAALTVSYGQPTNPSRFLATYGFLNDAPAAFCKYVISNPSQQLKDIGYDPDRMLFYTGDGSLSQEVWDVMLFSRLERKPDMAQVKDAFYQAHMTGDDETKNAIHAQFQGETINALLRHVNHILIEVHDLTVKMSCFDASKHPRLPLLKKHHAMVTSTFGKVRETLGDMPF